MGLGSLKSELVAGFAFVRSRVWLWGTFGAAALAYLLFMGPAEALVPFVVKNELGGDASDLGLVYALGAPVRSVRPSPSAGGASPSGP